MKLPTPNSLRQRFLLLVTGGVVVPLALVGLWLTGTASRSGKQLLRTRLDEGLVPVVTEAGARWIQMRAELLDIAEDPAVRAQLDAMTTADSDAKRGSVNLRSARASDMGRLATALIAPITLRSRSGDASWTLASGGDPAASVGQATVGRSEPSGADGISISLPVYGSLGTEMGRVETRVSFESIVPTAPTGAGAAGSVFLITDRASGRSLSALLVDPSLLAKDEFDLGGERWIVRRRTLEEPAVILSSAAPLAVYSLPFEEAARKGSIALLAVAIGTLGIAALLTRRLTRSLEELAVATRAVADGEIGKQVSEGGNDEVGRVGRAFNAMTESLRVTIRQLTQQEALAAVGKFAASLAHEVRNPLTSIRIDLQRVEERLPSDSPMRAPLARALREVVRLNDTVTGSLRLARSGSIDASVVDLCVPLQRAIEVAMPVFEQRGATLTERVSTSNAVIVRGDESALEQLFLNLLLNAADAVGRGGHAEVEVRRGSTHVVVEIRDSGSGMSPEQLVRIFEPFFSTKPQGTGLGLSVARQIAAAHAGSIEIESTVGAGTVVSTKLNLHSPAVAD